MLPSEILGRVREIQVRTGRQVADVLAGEYVSVFKGRGMEFDEVRPYVPGDDVRTIDWRVTARTGEPWVKKYVEEREQTVLFLLDLSPSMDAVPGVWSGRRAAVRVCALLGLAAAANQDRVGLIGFDDDVLRYIPAQKGDHHLLRILRECLVMRSRAAETNPEAALERVSRVVRRRSVVFLLSDFLNVGWGHAMARCAHRHEVVAVRLRGPELDGLTEARVRVADPETGVRRVIDGRDAAVRAGYDERVSRWLRETETAIREAGVDLIDVPIPRDGGIERIARPIDGFFRMRAHRGMRA